jgi:aromatic-L-amino-acid decarboxylase
MLGKNDFTDSAASVIEWIQNYFDKLESLPVKASVQPGDIYKKIPALPPNNRESLDHILTDLTEIILPGITHWQHPNFHAYFPANSSVESVLAEFVTAALGAQCMIWETSPAAAELEERMMEWIRDSIGLPESFEGVIQDTASTATLVAILTAREIKTNFTSNENGVPNNMRIYASVDIHSSIDKAVGISGIGKKNLVKIDVDSKRGMRADLLQSQIEKDIAEDKIPTCVVIAIGTTGTVAIDPLKEIAAICKKYDIWLHVDAAYAGTALLLPEYRWMSEGIEDADSFVFNPHKWMFTNFDCTAYYVKDTLALIKTFEVLPEYLKTNTRGAVNDYRDWGVPLGRRFRALKLWFVMRGYGLEGLRDKLRKHIKLNTYFAQEIASWDQIEIMQDPILNFTCFRYTEHGLDQEALNKKNKNILDEINRKGEVYLSHTKMGDQFIVRVVIGQTYVKKEHVQKLITVLKSYL